MFYRVKNNDVCDYADYRYANDCIETNITNSDNYSKNKNCYKIVQGVLKDISDTEECKEQLAEQETKIQAMKNITKRQLLFWLYQNKQKTETDIFTAIDTITDKDKKYLAQVSYNGTNNFYYGNEYTQLIGQALGLTIDELKQCFNEACNL